MHVSLNQHASLARVKERRIGSLFFSIFGALWRFLSFFALGWLTRRVEPFLCVAPRVIVPSYLKAKGKRKMQRVYLLLAILGAAIPYSQFVPWLLMHALAPRLFVLRLFVNCISTFFALDFLLSAVVLTLYIAHRGMQTRNPHLW